MNFMKLFEIQNVLDNRIIKDRGLQEYNLTEERILALLVEIGECTNEVRSFKFWSDKLPSEREVILEEFVDCLHFILSIGNNTGLAFDHITKLRIIEESGDINSLFIEFFHSVTDFRNNKTEVRYITIFNYFVTIANRLWFTQEEIINAYMEKNAINHERQEQGY
ncbi:dUTP diphosphatase [Virgibacillus sp. CBA3643]|uniref:dUTP diphosphatase n=1 Tax=Virgibacillus sp. CBA3643 TaxID=2942278 RepID=UPI0035A2FFA9